MMVGDNRVGKSSIIMTFLSDNITNPVAQIESTNSVDIFFKKINIKENSILVNLNIWDFSGELSENKIRSEFYSELHAVIYVFDLSNITSFNNIELWIKECKKFNGDKMIPVLVGNKSDRKREVSISSIEGLQEKYKLTYYEVIGVDYHSVLNFFSEFASNVYELRSKEKTR